MSELSWKVGNGLSSDSRLNFNYLPGFDLVDTIGMFGSDARKFAILDFNADGKDDIVRINNSQLNVVYSNGLNFKKVDYNIDSIGSYFISSFADLNGDGILELILTSDTDSLDAKICYLSA